MLDITDLQSLSFFTYVLQHQTDKRVYGDTGTFLVLGFIFLQCVTVDVQNQ